MKKLALIGLALCVVFMFAAPAMALDVDFSGFYRVRGFCVHDYEGFGERFDRFEYRDTVTSTDYYDSEGEHASDYWDMLLDVNIVFTVHPKLKLITNFTALDKLWGETDADTDGYAPATKEDSNNIDWNQAYMEFITGIGMFRVGRMNGGAWNHPFLNTLSDQDRIQWILPPKAWGGPSWNPLLVTYTYEKTVEADWPNTVSDNDLDQHVISIGYFSTNFTFDTLWGFVRNELPTIGGLRNAFPPYQMWWLDDAKTDLYLVSPYMKAKFGPVTVEGEARYTWGYITDRFKNGVAPGWEGDVEIEAWSWFLQTTFDSGPVDAYIGWAHTDGDKDGGMDAVTPGDQTLNSQTGQFGNDWDLLFFLTSDEGNHAATFGGMGNWSSAGSNPYGMDLIYFGGGFDISPTVNVSGIMGWAWADAVPTGSKQIGWEMNLWLTWQIMDGLQYKGLFAFFEADGFWDDAQNYPSTFSPIYVGSYGLVDPQPARSTADGSGQAWALMHQLTLSF